MPLLFEWDPDKAVRNFALHGVSFDEASTAFRDKLSSTIPDPRHSLQEERSILIGETQPGRLLVVAHTARGNRIRIISARLATKKERGFHEEGSA